jgi:osmotically-inducible protein OsmY
MKIAKLIAASTVSLALMTGTAFAGDTKEKVDDAWITTKVKTDLAKDSATKAHDIHVNTKSGVVVLTGTVASEAEKEKAEANAKSVKGVVNVENQLRVAAAD